MYISILISIIFIEVNSVVTCQLDLIIGNLLVVDFNNKEFKVLKSPRNRYCIIILIQFQVTSLLHL